MNTSITRTKKLLLLLMLVAFGQSAWATTYTWTGNVNRNWYNTGNWDLGALPTATDDIIVPVVGNTNNPDILSGTVNIRNVNISGGLFVNQSNATLVVNGTTTLSGTMLAYTTGRIQYLGAVTITNTGRLHVDGGGTATVYGPFTNNGIIDISVGGIFNALTNSSVTNNNILNVAGVYVAGPNSYFLEGGSSAITNTGSMRFQRNMPNTGYNDVSSPVNATVGNIDMGTFSLSGNDGVECYYAYTPYPNLQRYSEALDLDAGGYDEGWLSITGTGNTTSPLMGIAARLTSGTTFTFEGTPNNGNLSRNITKTNSCNCSEDGWNFLGNPYPSGIDWVSVATANSANITGSVYVFSATGAFTGNWGVVNSGGVTSGSASRYIGMGQGFFVKATTASASFNMTNAMRILNTTSTYKSGSIDNEVRLKLSDGIDMDEIVAYTDANATAGNDQGLDAEKMAAGSTVSIAFENAGGVYAINALNEINAATVLPLEILVTNTGTYTITPTLNLSTLSAYLKDGDTGLEYDLAATTPSFILTGGVTYTGRFSVVFKDNNATGITTLAENSARIYSSGNKVFIERTGNQTASIVITNLLGQEIANVMSGDTRTEIALNTPSLSYVFVKVTEGNKVSVAKVSVNNIK